VRKTGRGNVGKNQFPAGAGSNLPRPREIRGEQEVQRRELVWLKELVGARK
jgi:hypothetical protein